jgi:cellobiose phosphorylase
VEIEDGVIYHKTEYRERRNHFAYLACSAPLVGFDTQREDFLGPYRGFDRPASSARKVFRTDSIAHGWAPIGSHHIQISRWLLGESYDVIFLLGYHENPVDAKFDPHQGLKLSIKPPCASCY